MRANLDRIQADLGRLQGAGRSRARRPAPRHPGRARAKPMRPPIQRTGGGDPAPRRAACSSRCSGRARARSSRRAIRRPDGRHRAAATAPICVRTCDGFFWPISFATDQSRFQDDERTCQRSCPAAEVVLYSHRNPGEDVSQAVSLTRPALLHPAERVQIPPGVRQQLQLPGARRDLGECAAQRRGHHRRARRHRGERGARAADVAAALRRAGPADPAGAAPRAAAQSRGPRRTPHPRPRPCPSRRAPSSRRSPRSRSSPIRTARCARSARPSWKR